MVKVLGNSYFTEDKRMLEINKKTAPLFYKTRMVNDARVITDMITHLENGDEWYGDLEINMAIHRFQLVSDFLSLEMRSPLYKLSGLNSSFDLWYSYRAFDEDVRKSLGSELTMTVTCILKKMQKFSEETLKRSGAVRGMLGGIKNRQKPLDGNEYFATLSLLLAVSRLFFVTDHMSIEARLIAAIEWHCFEHYEELFKEEDKYLEQKVGRVDEAIETVETMLQFYARPGKFHVQEGKT